MRNIINLKGLIIIVIIIGIIIGIFYGFYAYEDLFTSNEKSDLIQSKVIVETKNVTETKNLEVLENKNSLTNEVINNELINTELVKEQKIYSKKKKIILICGITTGIICTGVAAYCFIPAVAPLVNATTSAALELATTTDFSSLPGVLGSILASFASNSTSSGNFSNENLPSTGPTVTFYNTNNTNNINNINTTISPLNYELPDLVEEEVTRVPTPPAPAEPILTQPQPQPQPPTPTHSPTSNSSNSNSQLRFSGLNRYSSYSRVPLLFTTRSPVVEQPVISLETMGILPEDTSSN